MPQVIAELSIMAPTWSEVASLLNSVLAWPVAAVVIVLILREDLKELLGRLHSYEGMGQKLTFGNHVALAEEAAQRADATGVDPTDRDHALKPWGPVSQAEDTEPVPPPAKRDAPSSGKWKPSQAMRRWTSNRLSSVMVLAAWEQLWASIMIAAIDVDPTSKRKWNEGRGPTLDRLVSLGVVSPSFRDAVRELNAARDQVADDGYDPTYGAARAFAKTARDLSESLRRAADAYVKLEPSRQ